MQYDVRAVIRVSGCQQEVYGDSNDRATRIGAPSITLREVT